MVGGRETDRCPEKYLTHENKYVYGFWKKYRKHGLPFGSDWGNQSAVMQDVFSALDVEYQEFEEKRQRDNGS